MCFGVVFCVFCSCKNKCEFFLMNVLISVRSQHYPSSCPHTHKKSYFTYLLSAALSGKGKRRWGLIFFIFFFFFLFLFKKHYNLFFADGDREGHSAAHVAMCHGKKSGSGWQLQFFFNILSATLGRLRTVGEKKKTITSATSFFLFLFCCCCCC